MSDILVNELAILTITSQTPKVTNHLRDNTVQQFCVKKSCLEGFQIPGRESFKLINEFFWFETQVIIVSYTFTQLWCQVPT